MVIFSTVTKEIIIIVYNIILTLTEKFCFILNIGFKFNKKWKSGK